MSIPKFATEVPLELRRLLQAQNLKKTSYLGGMGFGDRIFDHERHVP